jgi:hypothetical protein
VIRVVTRDDVLTLVVGLSRADTELLLEGVPVDLNLAAIDPRLPEMVVVLMASETDEALAAEVNGTVGKEIVAGKRCSACGRPITITQRCVMALMIEHFTDVSTGRQVDAASWQPVHTPRCAP